MVTGYFSKRRMEKGRERSEKKKFLQKTAAPGVGFIGGGGEVTKEGSLGRKK